MRARYYSLGGTFAADATILDVSSANRSKHEAVSKRVKEKVRKGCHSVSLDVQPAFWTWGLVQHV